MHTQSHGHARTLQGYRSCDWAPLTPKEDMAQLILSLAHKSGGAGAYKHGLRKVHRSWAHPPGAWGPASRLPQFLPTIKDLPRDWHSGRFLKFLKIFC